MSAAYDNKKTPEAYALALMDNFFSDEEMRNHLFIKKKRSRSNKDILDQVKVKKVFSEYTFQQLDWQNKYINMMVLLDW